MEGSAPRLLRVFLGSPSDVAEERMLAATTLAQLPFDPILGFRVIFRPIAWDSPRADVPLSAAYTPQEAIAKHLPLPSECDVAVFILSGRLGTPMADVKPPAYRFELDGVPAAQYLSGTEWEIVEALEGFRQKGTPEVLLYHCIAPPAARAKTPVDEEAQRQRRAVTAFVEHLERMGRGVNRYDTPSAFQQKFEANLRHLVAKVLATPTLESIRVALAGDEYLDLVTSEADREELVRAFVIDIAQPTALRLRGLEVLQAADRDTSEVVNHLLADADAGLREGVARLLARYPRLATTATIEFLFRDEKDIALAAVRSAAALAYEGRFDSTTFTAAREHEAWEVRLEAIRAIIALDDDLSVQSLAAFRSTKYHVSRSNARNYFERKFDDGSLTEPDRALAIGLLEAWVTDGQTKDLNLRRARDVLAKLQG